MDMGAVFSENHEYRYQLTRRWGDKLGFPVFIMLNPSTADAIEDDPTIRRCIGFAKSWGWNAICVVNLFAFRATSPKILKTAIDPIGERNDFYIRSACFGGDPIVCAWGNHGDMRGRTHKSRSVEVKHLLWYEFNLRMWSFGTTTVCMPKHPLYLPKETELQKMI